LRLAAAGLEDLADARRELADVHRRRELDLDMYLRMSAESRRLFVQAMRNAGRVRSACEEHYDDEDGYYVKH
jgi:hypothetical protein